MISFQCAVCKRNNGDGTCEAFPEGIPAEIERGIKDHSKPIEGDGGKLFQFDPDSAMADMYDPESQATDPAFDTGAKENEPLPGPDG